MKKNMIGLGVLTAATLLSGCMSQPNPSDVEPNSVETKYSISGDNGVVKISDGFIIDGDKNQTIDFGVIKLSDEAEVQSLKTWDIIARTESKHGEIYEILHNKIHEIEPYNINNHNIGSITNHWNSKPALDNPFLEISNLNDNLYLEIVGEISEDESISYTLDLDIKKIDDEEHVNKQ